MRLDMTFVLIAILLFSATSSHAQTGGSLNYQGYVTDAAGAAVDGTVVATFSLYATDLGGAPLWFQASALQVDQGLFSTALGNPANPFPAGLFDTPLWLGITINGDGEMLPRRALATVAYAARAEDTGTLQGLGPAAFDQSAHVANTDNPHGVTAVQTGAASLADLAAVQAQLDIALGEISTLQAAFATTQDDLATANAQIATFQTALNNESAERVAADSRHDGSITTIEANSVLALDGILSNPDGATARFEGVNVQIVNGTGFTHGVPNSLGNLLIGYDQASDSGALICSDGSYDNEADCLQNEHVWASVHKTGSHNVVIGDAHNYSRSGGLVAGSLNNITGIGATVVGGTNNSAGGDYSSITAGFNNYAEASYSSINGGAGGLTSGVLSSISGGSLNIARGNSAHVSGGSNNEANGDSSSVAGGSYNRANARASTVSGGGGFAPTNGNTVIAQYGSISGGQSNLVVAGADHASIAGGQSNVANGVYSHISGGRANTAWGNWTVIAGGNTNIAGDTTAAPSDPVNRYSVVVGGQFNATKGQYSVVSGGSSRSATGGHDWRAGSLQETQ